jgi:hypothetical protein
MTWILIAVGLFAALGYAVSQNMRGGSPELLSQEIAKSNATEILQFASSIRRAVQALKIEGIADTEISFENPIVSGYDNPDCGAGKNHCKVFSPTGGGVSYVIPSEDWLISDHKTKDHYKTWLFSGSSCVADVGTGDEDCDIGPNTGDEELILFLPYINKVICKEINKKLGFNLPDGEPLQEGTSAWHSTLATAKFTGTYVNDSEIGDVATEYRKTRAGCFQGSGIGTPPAGTYTFYEVILAR